MQRYERICGQRIRCYDNGGKTADRYTVVYIDQPETPVPHCRPHFACVGMSAEPFHPQGFGQHSVATCGAHLGQRVPFATLPADCRRLVESDLTPEPRAPRKRRPLPAAGEWHTVSRDPFARHTLEARRVYDIGNADCKWCGQSKHTRATRTPYLFQFRVNPDAGRAHEVPALYCSVGCMRSYQS